MQKLGWSGVLGLACALAGCGGAGGVTDDAGTGRDAFSPGTDTGVPAVDGGVPPGTDGGPGVDAGPGHDAGPPPSGSGAYFDHGGFWTDDVYDAPLDPDSAAMISALRATGGWGHGDVMQIDFSFEVLVADGATPERTFEPTGDFYSPDCDEVPMPVPVGGLLEGETGYECTNDGDCHLIVFRPETHELFEMWRANIVGPDFFGGCLAVWDTSRRYGPEGRGLQCTSADAAGFPISPLLFTADEVASGEIDHAIRFILPNDRIRPRSFVAPATHGTNTTGDDASPSYGVHLRLRRDFPLDSLPSEGARVVARAMQRYGMFHADGGQIALTALSDRATTAHWDGLLDARDLDSLTVEDFEVVDHGDAVPLTYDCVR